ncbi:hypothetical protein AAFF_G00428760 [Aldrovandia affinis]|uniref:Uncharacterized protein n=1 Tax=Aldrovandia affinis TaxID=143900 RepID=A0AAD7WIJ0_9TELE|nr:hypothetical protein AAFF_G00428760 [Aldrovandia affinis]
MLVQVKYKQLQKYVKLDEVEGRFDFLQFHDKGGPSSQRAVNVEEQLDGDACKEAMSLLNHTTDTSLIFQKMRETFQHRQKLVNDPGNGVDILSTFPRFLDTKGLPTTQKWPPCCCCCISFHHHQGDRSLQKGPQARVPAAAPRQHTTQSQTGYTSSPGTVGSASVCGVLCAVESVVSNPASAPGQALHRGYSCTLFLSNVQFPYLNPSHAAVWRSISATRQGRQPYLLAVGRQKSKIDSFYIVMDKHLIPCQANRSLGAFDELFKAHFVFNVSYDVALVNFYTFLQTTVYNIDVGKMKETPRVRELRARLLNHTVVAFFE